VPVIALSQLNRDVERRDGHRPRMSDLREGGTIEQDADVIMLLHREDYYRMSDADFVPDNIAEVIVAKQRNGPHRDREADVQPEDDPVPQPLDPGRPILSTPMTRAERESRDTLRGVGRFLTDHAQDPRRPVASIVLQARAMLELAEAHAATSSTRTAPAAEVGSK
jgi:hypothetical protein